MNGFRVALPALFALSLALPHAAAAQDAAAGEGVFKRVCSTCHNPTVDGPRKLGPTLHGVVGRKVASVEGFRYSTAKRDADLVWTPEKLNVYLLNPREFMPGTTMAYAGLKSDTDRGNLIAYLQTLK
ncbi:MAG: cytochrome c family protein [Proteobacteria bacterium]|nr:cytochrome c family protein [Pseudomonadota bacterium]